MSLIIADSSLLTYALYHGFEWRKDSERTNWICNSISGNIEHIDHATLLHLNQMIDDHVKSDWLYLERKPFYNLQDTIVAHLKVYA